MFRATVRMYCLGMSVGSDFANRHFSLDGWTQLQHAIKVRDRLMHPHEPPDIVVEQDDLYAVRDGMNWYNQLLQDIDAEHDRVMKALKDHLEVLKIRKLKDSDPSSN
jgi:hypothetical protein